MRLVSRSMSDGSLPRLRVLSASRRGLHQQTIARMRKQLRTDCPELVAKAVAVETARNIAEALAQQRGLKKLRVGLGL